MESPARQPRQRGTPVTDAQSLSAPHSVQIGWTADIFHELDIWGGTFSFSLWQYIPSTSDLGTTQFMLMNLYDNWTYNFSTWLTFNLNTGLLNDEFVAGDENVPLVYDRWAEIRVDIDLDSDSQTVYYDGGLVSTNTWLMGDPTAQLALEGVELYGGNGADDVYYDSIMVVPEPGIFLLAGLGLLALIRRRK